MPAYALPATHQKPCVAEVGRGVDRLTLGEASMAIRPFYSRRDDLATHKEDDCHGLPGPETLMKTGSRLSCG